MEICLLPFSHSYILKLTSSHGGTWVTKDIVEPFYKHFII